MRGLTHNTIRNGTELVCLVNGSCFFCIIICIPDVFEFLIDIAVRFIEGTRFIA